MDNISSVPIRGYVFTKTFFCNYLSSFYVLFQTNVILRSFFDLCGIEYTLNIPGNTRIFFSNYLSTFDGLFQTRVRFGSFSDSFEIEYTSAYLSLCTKHKWESFCEITALQQPVMSNAGDILTKLTDLCSICYTSRINYTYIFTRDCFHGLAVRRIIRGYSIMAHSVSTRPAKRLGRFNPSVPEGSQGLMRFEWRDSHQDLVVSWDHGSQINTQTDSKLRGNVKLVPQAVATSLLSWRDSVVCPW